MRGLIYMKSTRFLLAVYSIAALLGAMASAHADTVKKPAAKGTRAAADFTKSGEPNVLSHAVMVYDQTTGQPLFAKNADSAMPIASITKLMTSMVVLDAMQAMDETITIDRDDVDTLKGSHSRLPVGTPFHRDDLMRLALMASDNRAAAALGRTYPGSTAAMVEAMNAKARALNLENTRFVDPTGLAPGNVASPADLARLVDAASKYERIREYTTTPALNVTLPNAKRPIGFQNTNALVRSGGNWDIGLSKTGYINEAGKCLVMQAMIASRPVVIVLLDSWGKLTRIGDANRIKKWIEKTQVAAISAKTS